MEEPEEPEEPPSHTLIIIVHIGSSHSQANMEYWDISPCPAGQHWTARNIVFYAEKVDCDCEIVRLHQPTAQFIIGSSTDGPYQHFINH